MRTDMRSVFDEIDSLLSRVRGYIASLENDNKILLEENMELSHECNDLSSANIMIRAGQDYANRGVD